MAETKVLVKSRQQRVCRRCHRPLTDVASINEGIGPVCRQLDNRLLSRLFVADFDAALRAHRRVDEKTLCPETVDAFLNLRDAIRKKRDTGNEDLREEVKRIEWILSFEQTESNVDNLITIVDALGYLGLANILRGEATTAQATIAFEDGRFYIAAPRNKAGQEALKRIGGRFHPKEDMESARWSVPARQAEAFFLAVASYYPNSVGLQDAVEEAEAYSGEQRKAPRAGETWVPPPQKAFTRDFGAFLTVQAPYNPAFIEAIKALPPADRRWDSGRREWEVAGRQREAIRALIAKYFPESL